METPKKTYRALALVDRIAIGIATAGGAGFVPKVPGTIGSLLGVLIYLLIYGYGFRLIYLGLLVMLIPLSVWAAGHVEGIYGKDASQIAIDEVVGQMITLGFVVRSGTAALLTTVILGFLLFRFFDILKPFPIRHLERLPRGFGVVADDVGAGIYGFLTLVLLESLAGRFF